MADFSFGDFSSTSGLTLNGSAHQVGNVVRMTDDQTNSQAGNAWVDQTQSVGGGFSTRFVFSCDGVGDIPADGMAFCIQTDGTSAMGNGGGDNAMLGITGSVVVNFQSFWNKVQFVATDGSGNQVGFQEVEYFGLHRSTPWTADISYDAGTSAWVVALDSTVVLVDNLNLADAVSLVGGTDAYVGLGAGTGLGYDNNDAHSWQLAAVPEPFTLVSVGVGVAALLRRPKRSS